MKRPDEFIYHLVGTKEWEAIRHEPRYAPFSLETEGFLHASGTVDQLVWVANRRFRDVPDVSVLVIDRLRVDSPIRDEGPGPEGPFPHIYGSLNADAIVEVRRLIREVTGVFNWS